LVVKPSLPPQGLADWVLGMVQDQQDQALQAQMEMWHSPE